jgi:hypothetical protein
MTKIIKTITLIVMAVALSGCIIAISDDWDDHHYNDSASVEASSETVVKED